MLYTLIPEPTRHRQNTRLWTYRINKTGQSNWSSRKLRYICFPFWHFTEKCFMNPYLLVAGLLASTRTLEKSCFVVHFEFTTRRDTVCLSEKWIYVLWLFYHINSSAYSHFKTTNTHSATRLKVATKWNTHNRFALRHIASTENPTHNPPIRSHQTNGLHMLLFYYIYRLHV